MEENTDQIRFVTLVTRIQRFPRRRHGLLRTVQQHWAGPAYGMISRLAGGRALANRAGGISPRAILSPRPFEEQMKRLNLIHSARWFVLYRLPARESRRLRRLLFFVSNFDRETGAYVEAFVDGFGEGGLAAQWADAPGWPTKDATVAKLLRFALVHHQPALHEFKAYPEATTNDVRSALQVDRTIHAFDRETASLDPDRPEDRLVWSSAFSEMLGRLQPCLGQIKTAPVDRDLAVDHAQRRSRRHSLLLLAPFDLAHFDEVRAGIEQLHAELFSNIGLTHTARLGVLRGVFDDGRGRVRPLRHGYLLCSSEFHVEASTAEHGDDWREAAKTYVQALLSHSGASKIWEPAMRFAQVETEREFLAYLCHRRRFSPRSGPLYEPTMAFVDFPHVTPSAVMHALETHRQFEEFLVSDVATDGADDPASIRNFRSLTKSTRRVYV